MVVVNHCLTLEHTRTAAGKGGFAGQWSFLDGGGSRLRHLDAKLCSGLTLVVEARFWGAGVAPRLQ